MKKGQVKDACKFIIYLLQPVKKSLHTRYSRIRANGPVFYESFRLGQVRVGICPELWYKISSFKP